MFNEVCGIDIMRKVFWAFVAVVIGFGVFNGWAAEEQTVTLAEVPAAVQKTIATEVDHAKAKLGEINRTTDDGEVSFEVQLTKPKEKRSVTIGVDGQILSRQVFLREMPEAARKTVRAQAQALQGKLESVDLVMDAGTITYDATVTKGPREISFTVSEEGKLLAMEITINEAPAAVQKTIRAKTAGCTVKSIEKNFQDEDGVTYDVEMSQDGKKVSFSVTDKGDVIAE